MLERFGGLVEGYIKLKTNIIDAFEDEDEVIFYFLILPAAFVGFGNVICGYIFDKFRFKRLVFILVVLQSLMCLILLFSSQALVFFAGYYLCFSLYGGFITLFLALLARVYGFKTGPYLSAILFIVWNGLQILGFLSKDWFLKNPDIFVRLPAISSILGVIVITAIKDRAVW
eukprot:TRINITY_DN1629_c0_g1_i2.p2 TRINITY_DN1629_c0_g1~~TRINITY_DN1629_c0_g1_i2.p2  ORF type:complete len:172 (-),score=35.15 TRINITY_DN1629_c0_g1_i2:185-700(-)